MKTPKSLIALIVVLALFFVRDLADLATGGIASADVYYLPLLELNLGELEQPIVDRIIERHSRVVIGSRWFWLVAHGIALGLALLVLRKIRQSGHPQLSKNSPQSASGSITGGGAAGSRDGL